MQLSEEYSAWAIKDQYGDVWALELHRTRTESWDWLVGFLQEDRKKLYRMGYRCIRVTITPND